MFFVTGVIVAVTHKCCAKVHDVPVEYLECVSQTMQCLEEVWLDRWEVGSSSIILLKEKLVLLSVVRTGDPPHSRDVE